MAYRITWTRLRKDLELAFYMARRHKRNKSYVREYEKDLSHNLDMLTNMLYNREYRPSTSFCFIIHEPKTREIFAARFTDRIVHHLYFNMTSKMYESLLIADSYSCRDGKGTHYGVRRLYDHIRKATENYTVPAYILQLDIRGYFININRLVLKEITHRIFDRMADRHTLAIPKGKCYKDKMDFDFIRWLNDTIIMTDPTENCIIRSPKEAWDGLPASKSLFKTNPYCGLPIGNLTSQLFSNVYLNELDQYMKRNLNCKHYGRYVDDLYVVMTDKERLRQCAVMAKEFLHEHLHLELNEGKTRLTSTRQGVKFLGHFVKEHRVYLNNATLNRMKRTFSSREFREREDVASSVNSYLGMFSHCNSLRIRKELFGNMKWLKQYGTFDPEYRKFSYYKNLKKKRA